MKTADFVYHLPPEYIAQTPVEPRDSSKLMVLERGTGEIRHRVFREICSYLQAGDLLVLNDTRVIPARLGSRKTGTGGRVEILLLECLEGATWLALVGGRKVREGTVLELVQPDGVATGVQGKITQPRGGGQWAIEFNRPASEWLWEVGQTPLPPYIRGYTGDPERYQTVYSRHDGSAAAPTAGLHLTAEMLLRLREMKVELAYLTLQIGLDTFKPIDEKEISAHAMHSEWMRLGAETARQVNETKSAGGRVIAVGTTVVRALETVGLVDRLPGQESDPRIGCTVSAWEGPTNLFVTPGFRFRVVDAMITNFHLPRSTLLVLVSAFAGLESIKRAYAAAMAHGYRFYSFGDAMLIL